MKKNLKADVPGTIMSRDLDVAIAQAGAIVVPFSGFLNSGGDFVIRETNEDFLKEVGFALKAIERRLIFSKTTLLGTEKTEIYMSFGETVVVRKKGYEYYVKGIDGMWIATTALANV